MKQTDAERQLEILKRGVVEILPEEDFERKLIRTLEESRSLRVKIGIDPTSPHIHLGHMVQYEKLRAFQELGHIGLLVIGDFTARIGDPTGRDTERPAIDPDQVRKNAKTYTDQIFKIVDPGKVEVHYQSAWFDSLTLSDVLKLTSNFSVGQILAHETYRQRIDAGQRLGLHELLYPVLQAYDSVELNPDVELGGTDQKFNILAGRQLMNSLGMDPQAAMFMPLLSGPDHRKMSKSFGNNIPVESTSEEMFGMIMSIPDDLMEEYFTLLSGFEEDQLQKILVDLKNGEIHPRDGKLLLARSIVGRLISEGAAKTGEKHFTEAFSRRKEPEEIESFTLPGPLPLPVLLRDSGMVSSASEARRLITSGAVKIDGEKILDVDTVITPAEVPFVLSIGRRKFRRIL